MQQRVRTARGFTLIEVMVALIVLVLGVLGAAGMTLTALRDTKQSSTRSQAVALAYEFADLMRANPGNEAIFTGAVPTTPVLACYSSAGCNRTEMAQNEFREWNRKVTAPVSGLPGGNFVICHDATNLGVMGTAASCDNSASSPLVVKMSWDEKQNDGTFLPTTPSSPPRLVMPIQP